jgi:hypothetical protein
LNLADLIFALILLLATMRGWSKGLLGVAAGYVAPVLGFLAASEWSGPVRDLLAQRMPDAEIILDLVAPVLVFIVVLLTVRILAAVLARVLGVGLSVPGRVLAATASTIVSALVLGAIVILTHELCLKFELGKPEPGKTTPTPVETRILEADAKMRESLLGPVLAELAQAAFNEAMEYRDRLPSIDEQEIEQKAKRAAEAAEQLRKLPLPRPDGGGQRQ